MNEEQENLYNELVSKYDFNEGQLYQIRIGLINGVDIYSYLSLISKKNK